MAKFNSKIILWLSVLAVGATLLVISAVPGEKTGEVSETDLPFLSFSPEPDSNVSPQATPRPTVPASANFTPATCQLEGKIVFINKNLYRTEGAKIKYQNVDDKTRQIYWAVTPDDGALRIGPNLFEQLTIPNGEREVGAALYADPTVKQYNLTARITYGLPNSDDVAEAKCDGRVVVEMP